MKTIKDAIFIIVAVAGLFFLSFEAGIIKEKSVPERIGPSYLYPVVTETPGKADTLNPVDLIRLYNGETYSQSHRNVLTTEKKFVCDIYSCEGKVEIDHFIPLCGGGSNDIENLWAQPEVNLWNGVNYGFREKDRLESHVCSEIKKGRISPKEAFDKMQDWVYYYQQTFPKGFLGGVDENELDGDIII